MTDPGDIACAFCCLVAVDGGPAICSPCVMRCLHVLVTGDEVAASEEPSFALTVLGRAVAAQIGPPDGAGAI